MAQVQANAQNQSQTQGIQGQGVVREAFGVDVLDSALEGGVPRGTWVVVTGEPGVGKSILAMHFAWSGLASGEPVIYVTTESSFRDVVRQGGQFNMRFTDYKPVNLVNALTGRVKVKPGEVNLVVIDLFGLYRQYREMLKASEEEGSKKPSRALSIEVLEASVAKAYELLGFEEGRPSEPSRLIIDSMTAFWADKPAMARAYSYRLRQALYRQNITALLTSQYAPTTEMSFGFGLEHIADGIIHMWMDNVTEAKEVRRWLIIKKMRMTNHSKKAYRVDIQPGKGIELEEYEGE
ncbi:MAG: KaiC domain-containing protein [Vulcanisaeta sp.]